jgi:hypothetical protein
LGEKKGGGGGVYQTLGGFGYPPHDTNRREREIPDSFKVSPLVCVLVFLIEDKQEI